MMKQLYYPEIYLSNEIYNLITSTPSLPQKPERPIKPSSPIKPILNINWWLLVIWVIIITGLFISFVVETCFENDNAVYYLTFFSVFAFIIFFLKKVDIELIFKDLIGYKKAVNAYKISLQNFPSLEAEYEKKLHDPDYQKRLLEYDTQVKKLTSEFYVRDFRKKIIGDYLSYREKPEILCCTKDDNIKTGVSEMPFRAVLLKNGFKIYVDKKIKVDEQRFYYPDILIHKDGLFIDIEIDEPYSGENGMPIHYLDEFSDEERNMFFRSCGFEVIRFAEEQICKFPEACVSVINDFIDLVLSGGDYYETISTHISIKKWTLDEAFEYADRQHRNTYLPQPINVCNINVDNNINSIIRKRKLRIATNNYKQNPILTRHPILFHNLYDQNSKRIINGFPRLHNSKTYKNYEERQIPKEIDDDLPF